MSNDNNDNDNNDYDDIIPFGDGMLKVKFNHGKIPESVKNKMKDLPYVLGSEWEERFGDQQLFSPAPSSEDEE